MARRGGFRTQAPRTITVVISGVLWLIGTLEVLDVAHIIPSPYAVWSLVAAGFLLLLGALFDGL